MNKAGNLYIALMIFLFCTNSALVGQIEHINRFEIEYDWRYENHEVVSNDDRGLTLIQTNRETLGRTYQVKFTHLDKKLEEVWVDSTLMSSKMHLMGYHYLKDRMFVMFQDFPVKKRIEILSLDYKTKTITRHNSNQEVELTLTEFEMIGSTALLGGYLDLRPVVYAFDLKNDRVKALRGIYKNNSKLFEVKVNKDSVTFNVLVGEQNNVKDQTVVVNTYDYEGNQIRDYSLITKTDYSLLDGVSSSINDITQVVVGNYGYKSETLPSGIYINYVNRVGEQVINYFNYSESDSFLNYLKDSREEKVKAKAMEIKANGKEQRYKLLSLTRALKEVDGKLIFTAEYFKPGGSNRIASSGINGTRQGNFTSNNERDAFGNFVQTPINDFDFTHGYTLVLDEQGKKLWDDSFDIDFTLENSLDEHGRFQWVADKEHIVYVHYDDKEVIGKILNDEPDNEVQKAKISIQDGHEKRDELQSTVRITGWYDDLFLVQGIHNVRLKDKSEASKKVFFINAIRINSDGTPKKMD